MLKIRQVEHPIIAARKAVSAPFPRNINFPGNKNAAISFIGLKPPKRDEFVRSSGIPAGAKLLKGKFTTSDDKSWIYRDILMMMAGL